jgi:hypothetical protein
VQKFDQLWWPHQAADMGRSNAVGCAGHGRFLRTGPDDPNTCAVIPGRREAANPESSNHSCK